MKRTNVNFLIDLAAFAEFALLASTGVLVRYVLPPGSGHSASVWGLDRHEWGGVHFWIAVAFVSTLLVHLALHWKWIVCTVKGARSRRPTQRLLAGGAALAALLAIAVLPLLASVKQAPTAAAHRAASPAASQPAQASQHDTLGIRGSMTLAEVEQATGVPAAVIKTRLGLAASTPDDERLGRLKRTYGFEIDAVREVVAEQQRQ